MNIIKNEELIKNKKLSIIVPCYKVEQYLSRCMDSLVNQTLEDIEIIAINDGSPDNCLEILKQYQNKYPSKVVIIDKENEGVWRGRTDGVRIASGEYIGFVDSDDYVALDFAEQLYNKAKYSNADISVCGFDRIDMITEKRYSQEMCKSDDKVIIVEEDPGALLEINASPWNKIYRAHLLKDMYQMKHVPRILDDMMFINLAYLKANKFVFVNKSLVYYMIRSDSIINTIRAEHIEPTYESMIEVREVYAKERPSLLNYIDACAFLHLGISLMYRLSEDKSIDFNQALKRNKEVLDNNFPNWNKTEYTKFNYVLKNHGTNGKLWIVKGFYNIGLFKQFLATYKFMINKAGIDIKW